MDQKRIFKALDRLSVCYRLTDLDSKDDRDLWCKFANTQTFESLRLEYSGSGS